ncbi:class A beta-lactamase [Consotaella salsifontis]
MFASCAIIPMLLGSMDGALAEESQSDKVIATAVAEVERTLDARVGVAVLDTGTGHHWSHRGAERFPMASTSKAFACATLLKEVDAGRKSLDETVAVEKDDILSYAPVTKDKVGEKMSLGALCEAATGQSDNTAINLALEAIGGPAKVTAFIREIGDTETRLDRTEPELNEGTPGDPRDTTTPEAAVASLKALVLGDALSEKSRAQLETWLENDKVAGPLLRASIPTGWRIADRSGAGGHGTRGIVATIWPPKRSPVVVAVYLTETDADMDKRNAAIAAIGSALVKSLGD